jgi:hypothetical protein
MSPPTTPIPTVYPPTALIPIMMGQMVETVQRIYIIGLVTSLIFVICIVIGFVMGSIGVHRGLVHNHMIMDGNKRKKCMYYGIISLIGLILWPIPILGPTMSIIGGTVCVVNM